MKTTSSDWGRNLPKRKNTFDQRCKSTCKKSTQIFWKSLEIHSEGPTSSHMPLSPQHAGRVGGCFTLDFWRFPVDLVDFLHVDSHLYLYYLRSIYRRQILTDKVDLYFCSKVYSFIIILTIVSYLISFFNAIVPLSASFVHYTADFYHKNTQKLSLHFHIVIWTLWMQEPPNPPPGI